MIKLPIRTKVTMLIILSSSIVLAFGLTFGLNYTQSKMEETVVADLGVVGDIADVYITSQINLLKANAHAVSSKITNEQSPDVIAKYLNSALEAEDHSDFIAFTLFDRNHIVAAAGANSMPLDYLNKEYIKKAFAGESVISTTRIAAYTGDVVINVCVPTPENQVLVATIDGYYFYDKLNDFTIWKTGHIFIDDKDGYVISNPRKEWIKERWNFIKEAETNSDYQSVSDVVSNMIQGQKGHGEFSMNGVDRVCVYRPITGSKVGWSLGVIGPLPESPIGSMKTGFMLVGLVCLALCILVAVPISIPIGKQFTRVEELKEEAEDASRAKGEFLTNMSHEMRTPLNAIIGLTELTLGKNGIDKPARNNLEKVYNSGVTLLGLINDILDLSKIESGKFEILPVEYDTPSLINDTIGLNIVRIGSNPIDFNIVVDEKLPSRLIGDDLRIRQVFNNILSNAFKYTKEGTVIWTITGEATSDSSYMITSVVTDTGIGIKPEDLKKLFKEFNQVDTKSNRGTEGTGLGLSITMHLVEMMGGTIDVESEYGVGSTFTVKIPQKSIGAINIGSEVAEKLSDYKYSDQKRDRSAKLIRNQMPYARVLVIDDVATNLDVAHGMLSPYGMTIDCVSSGIKAIELIEKADVHYDALFMDHMMPVMDGIEATKRIREIGTDYARTVPIIALTANAISGNEEMFLKNGFQAFLSKPIDIMKLDAAVNKWVRDKTKEKENSPINQDNMANDKGISGEQDGQTEQDLLLSNLYEISGLDVEKGLDMFGGSTNTYFEVLKSYILNTPDLLAQLDTYAEDNLPDYSIVVHGVKSSSRSIGALDIGTRAESLEMASKNNDAEYVHAHHFAFVGDTSKLINDIQEVIYDENVEADSSDKPEKDFVSHELIEDIKNAANLYDIDDIERLIIEIDGYKYLNDGDKVAAIKRCASALDFDGIVKLLS
ncbi:MAG: response regulator [Clostridiales Family XIII bacterium]|jgi:signal transduction histidine kinase/DNA-binding NarL/FixJ family response regulator/HPt (histidine-containing phosphotransfer) domain-containing protein|nr:response regulator [Clostridiales Family XIII bacterium]